MSTQPLHAPKVVPSFGVLLLDGTAGAKTFGILVDRQFETWEAATWNDVRPWSAAASCHDLCVAAFVVVVGFVAHYSGYAEVTQTDLGLVAEFVNKSSVDRAAPERW